MVVRRRLDAELVRRGLVPSREQARQAIADRRVLVGGAVAEKPARLVDAGEPVRVTGDGPRFVSRGGEKLDAALTRFGIDVDGLAALDAGASTGGFTDCLLQRGAASVVAVDVGHGQLHERLRADPRVELHERCNIRSLAPADLGGRRFPLVVADLSFISLSVVARALTELTAPDGQLVVLVKPQFEAGRREAARGRGVIRDPAVWRAAVGSVGAAFGSAGAVMMDVMRSPITGADGNVEFLAHLRRPSSLPLAGRPDLALLAQSVATETPAERPAEGDS
jgi:23S rRNA (cytidine1920-2'-O)/16S rRNA (cytidine1409-2'-O)-methyltransferase